MDVPHFIGAMLRGWRRAVSLGVLVICGVFLVNVTVPGYSGGGLLFGASGKEKPETAETVRAGSRHFNKYCSTCHPGGGNKFKPHLRLVNAPQLAEFETFLSYIRAPDARDGSPTIMINFPASVVSDQEAREIYQYVVQVLKKGAQ